MRRRRDTAPRVPELPLPKRPYRDTVVFNAILAAVIVGVAYLTAGELFRALVFAGGFFLVATVWSWWRFRTRLQAERREL